jgi:Rod binding domain-containing protein
MPISLNTQLSTIAPHDRALFERFDTDPRADRQSDFASVLGRAQHRPDEPVEDLARRSAEQFVAMALVQPLLKQLRDNNNAAPPFAPSQGEKQFQSLMDAEVAQRMVRAAHFPLVDRLARDMLVKVSGVDAPRAPSAPAEPKP